MGYKQWYKYVKKSYNYLNFQDKFEPKNGNWKCEIHFRTVLIQTKRLTQTHPQRH